VSRRLRRVGALVGAALIVTAASVSQAQAATFTVNSTADAADANIFDGVCFTAAGSCTLRAAVQQADALGGSQTIVLLGGTTYTLAIKGPANDSTDPAHGDLDVLANIAIRASGGTAVVQGQPTFLVPGFDDRIFDVAQGGSLSLDSIQVKGGHGGDQGGGIRNSGDLRLSSTTVSNNTATFGGGIWNAGGLDVELSTIRTNSATTGGGVFSLAGRQVLVRNTTIADNTAVQGGGFFSCCSSASGPTAAIDHSTISGNTATAGDGGGILNAQLGPSLNRLELINDTISGNRASRNGGGVWNAGSIGLNSDTIALNISDTDGDGAGDGGGLFFTSGAVSLANTILGANSDLSPGTKYPDCLGTPLSGGHNLIQSTLGCTVVRDECFSLAGGDSVDNGRPDYGPEVVLPWDYPGPCPADVVGRAPGLLPLQTNGGTTATQALSTGTLLTGPSPAIDRGTGDFGVACASDDQRGRPRPVDGNGNGIVTCDIGAYELQSSNALGTFSFDPGGATARVGDRNLYPLTWTVPGPGWRVLDTLQLRFVDEQGAAIRLRFDEVAGSPGTFRLVDDRGKAGPAFTPGSRNRLETDAATVYLAGSSVIGPPGSQVTLSLDLSFKPHAAGHTYDVEVLATDDTGQSQGFSRAGYLTVLP